jgi:hypothetical protein
MDLIFIVEVLVVAWLCFLGGFVIGAVFANGTKWDDDD